MVCGEALSMVVHMSTGLKPQYLLSNSSLVAPHPFHPPNSHHLKKPLLDKNLLKNYRPISNLPFLSKILEKVVLHKLLSHLQENNLSNPFQSAYRAGHSTDRFVTCCKWYSLRFGQWQHFCSSFVGSFCSYWPPNSPLPPELCFWHSVYCVPVVSVIFLRQISVNFSR